MCNTTIEFEKSFPTILTALKKENNNLVKEISMYAINRKIKYMETSLLIPQNKNPNDCA